MIQQFLQDRALLDLPVVAMVLFIAAFVAMVVRVWRQSDEDPAVADIARLPLDDPHASASERK